MASKEKEQYRGINDKTVKLLKRSSTKLEQWAARLEDRTRTLPKSKKEAMAEQMFKLSADIHDLLLGFRLPPQRTDSFMFPRTPDQALAAIVGVGPMPRTEITKNLWMYIKRRKLQDKQVPRMINCDEKLSRVCGNRKQVSMFELTKWVNKHITNLSPDFR